MPPSLEQQLGIYLTDAHALELQALEQVKRARKAKIAGDPEMAKAFGRHVKETERHVRLVETRLDALAWAPVPQKDITAKVSGIGMALFARFQPDTPGKLLAHAYSYERLELAVYDVLVRLAERAGDGETALTAEVIAKDEREMAARLVACLDRAVDASLRELGVEDAGDQLSKYLADAHAIEQQAEQLLKKGPKLASVQELASAFEQHLVETERHAEVVKDRLRGRDASSSAIKDAALRLGALNLGMLFKAQVDTPVKLAAFAYAFEHLEIAAYELLKRVAHRVQDEETVLAVDAILFEERAAAARIHGLFEPALEASLEQAGALA
jgi:ferritin-like metal-binding protein YciE